MMDYNTSASCTTLMMYCVTDKLLLPLTSSGDVYVRVCVCVHVMLTFLVTEKKRSVSHLKEVHIIYEAT